MLVQLDHFCSEHNIDYFLDGGTLLGAIRHSGFIPWDDDVDIMMPRDQYDKFIQYSQISDKYKIITSKNSQGYNYHYTYCIVTDTETVSIEKNIREQIGRGVFIDVFPYDGLPSNKDEFEKYTNKLRTLTTLLHYCNIQHAGLGNKMVKALKYCVLFSCHLFVPRKLLLREIDKLVRKYDYNKSEIVTNCVHFPWNKKDIQRVLFERKSYDEKEEHLFEGYLFNVPFGYDNRLKTQYGDYMTPPPQAERIGNHDIEYYWKTI